MKVLVVDDSAVQRKKISSFLLQCGASVDQACNGAEALTRLLSENEYGILITDWNMPEMDGLSLVKRVRAEGRLKDLPILMVTTENDPWSVTRAIRSGANEYLMKPFDQLDLLEKLRTVLGTDHRLFQTWCSEC
jgi:two-component system chemotaxis response regulator CheY